MPCSCLGINVDKCTCMQLRNEFPFKRNCENRLVSPAKRHVPNPVKSTNRSVLVMFAERIYDNCAGYNLRHCPLQGRVGRNCFGNLLRELAILGCFLLANLVVFTAILIRVFVYVSTATVESAKWIHKHIQSKTGEGNPLSWTENDVPLSACASPTT